MAEAIPEEGSKKIVEGLKNLFENFSNSNPQLNEEAKKAGLNFNNAAEFVQQIAKNGIAKDDKNPEAQKSQEKMGDSLEKIINYMTGNKEQNAKIDYKQWRDNLSTPAFGLAQELDKFNEITNYEYINSAPMRLVKKFISFLDKLCQDVEKISFDGIDKNEVKEETKKLEKTQKETVNEIQSFSELCKKEQLGPETAQRVQNNINVTKENAKQIINKNNKDIRTYGKMLDNTMDDYKYHSQRMWSTVYNDRLYELHFNERKEKADAAEKAFGERLNSNTLPKEFKDAMSTRLNVTNFYLNHQFTNKKEDLDAFRKALIAEDPFKLGTGKPGDKSLEEKFANASYDDLKKLQNQFFKQSDSDLAKFAKDYKDTYNEFRNVTILKQDVGRARNARIVASAEMAQEKALFLNAAKKDKNQQKVANNIDAMIETMVKNAKKLTDKEVVTKKIREADVKATEYAAKDPLGKQIMDVVNRKIKLNDYCKGVSAQTKPLENKVKTVNNALSTTDASVSILNNRATLAQYQDNSNRIKQTEDTMKAHLDRFAEQMDKGKRKGHIDSKEFETMKTALNAARENMTSANFSVLQQAAENYLEKKGPGNRFNSEMRQHRMDLAQSIAAFAENCSEISKNLKEVKDVNNKLGERINAARNVNMNKEMNKIEKGINPQIGTELINAANQINNGMVNEFKAISEQDGLVQKAIIAKLNKGSMEKAKNAIKEVEKINADPDAVLNGKGKEAPQIKAPKLKLEKPQVNGPSLDF